MRGPIPWLVGLVIVLAIAVVGLGAVIVAPIVTKTPTEALIEAQRAAFNARDTDAIRAYVTDDVVLWTSNDTEPAASGIDEFVALVLYGGLRIEPIGPVTEYGNLAWSLAHVSSTYDVAGEDQLAVYNLRDGKIERLWIIWESSE